MSEESLEAPEPDAAEQQEAADPAQADPGGEETVDVPLEADAADAAERARAVPATDDEDYR